MKTFFVTAEVGSAIALTPPIEALNGRPFNLTSWIVPWSGTADSLCRHLRTYTRSTVIALCADQDWSYR
jgi:hypothetical protein